MQLVDYSDSEPDEPVPPPMHLPCVVAGEQGNSTGRTSGRATVSIMIHFPFSSFRLPERGVEDRWRKEGGGRSC